MLERRLLRFIVVGGICFTTNLLVLYVGTAILGFHYLASMATSIVVANSLGWTMNRHWTFLKSSLPWWVEYCRYMSISFSSTMISLALMIFCVSLLGIHYLFASAVIAACMMMLNFVAHRDWSFTHSKHGSPRS